MTSAITHFCGELLSDISQCVTVGSIGEVCKNNVIKKSFDELSSKVLVNCLQICRWTVFKNRVGELSCRWTVLFPTLVKVRKVAKIRNRYNQVPHLTQDTTGESGIIQSNIKNERQEVSPFPAGDHKAAMNRRKSMTKQDINNTNDPQKKYRLGTVSKIFQWRA